MRDADSEPAPCVQCGGKGWVENEVDNATPECDGCGGTGTEWPPEETHTQAKSDSEPICCRNTSKACAEHGPCSVYRSDSEPTPDPDCENCDGRGCMGCIFREYDHDCRMDCPFCCPRESHIEAGSDSSTPAGEISEGACILEPVGGSYYPKCVRCGWQSAVGWSSLEQARRSCEHECRPDTSDDPVAEAFQAQAFVVDRPWSDGDYVILGHPDPHEGTLLAVCTEVTFERELEEGDEWPYTAQDAAREIARRWNEHRGLRESCASYLELIEQLGDERDRLRNERSRLRAALGDIGNYLASVPDDGPGWSYVEVARNLAEEAYDGHA